jgi:polysaccharide biosynthesis protein PslH
VNTLFITEQFPWPLNDGGNLRTWHVLEGLCRDRRVTLLSHEPAHSHADAARLPANLDRAMTVAKPALVQRLWSNVRRLGATRWPLFILKNWSEPLLALADELLARGSFDAIHFNHLDTAAFALVRNWPQAKVFDTHNCLAAMAGQVARERTNPLRSWIFAREARLLERLERRVALLMNTSLVCSRDDGQKFRHVCSEGNYDVVPNGVDTDYFQGTQSGDPEQGTIVLTGAMNYYPNEQAALFFCRDVLPLVRAAGRLVRTYIVGKQPTPRVKALHNDRDIFVTGAVPDVRPYVERAGAVIVPLQHGSGTRLKILEAFAMGKPVVSTRLGAEGIEAADGREILLADDATQFAARVVQLLDDRELGSKMGLAARRLVESRYAWPGIQERVRAVYSRLEAAPLEQPTLTSKVVSLRVPVALPAGGARQSTVHTAPSGHEEF